MCCLMVVGVLPRCGAQLGPRRREMRGSRVDVRLDFWVDQSASREEVWLAQKQFITNVVKKGSVKEFVRLNLK